MPIQECQLPGGGKGWKWGSEGHCYESRADAEKQAAAAHANGYAGDAEFNESDHPRDNDGKFSESGGGGEGITAYHGSKEKFTEFSQGKIGKRDAGYMGRGFYFSTDVEVANRDAVRMQVKLHVTKPLEISLPDFKTDKRDVVRKALDLQDDATTEDVTAALVSKGHDGVILDYTPSGYKHKEIMVPDEKQIEYVKHLEGNSAQDSLAFDRASVRTIDKDGHLHIAESNISKATVNPYLGREIPDWQALGLDGDRVYQLFRDPLELAKGAKTFDGKPLLLRHKPTDAEDHATDLVVGAVYNPKFVAPYLKAESVVWPGKAIDSIEDGTKKQFSCGYRYRADMTPGIFEGKAYDGVMRDIDGNHVALVEEGRAGPDVVVGDSNGEMIMAKTVLSRKAAVAQGALLVYLRPKLAQDAKIDLTPALANITKDNFKANKPGIIAALIERTKGKLAQDAALDDAGTLLDSLEALDIAEDEVMSKAKCEDEWPDKDDDKDKAKDKKAKAKDEWPDKDDDKKKEAEDEDDDEDDDDEKKKKAASDKGKKGMDAAMKDLVTKSVMETAIKEATVNAVKTQQEIRDAERAVRPYVGDLPMAHDSAQAVYRAALDAKGVDTEGINELVALKRILELQPKPSDQKASPRVAMDAAGTKSFNDMFPEAARIRLM